MGTATGLLSTVTDPNNQSVSYTYDTRRRVTNVKTTQDGKVYQNSYAYSNDRLASVSHNTTSDACDVTYTFGYDAVGRPTTVKVGTQVLSTNAYNDTGTLNSVTYGNGGKVAYAYDTFKRPTTVYYDSSTNPRYQCSYGSNGQVARVRDAILVRYIQSEYDSTGRPVRVRTTSGNSHVYTGEVGYDQYNNLAYFKEQVGTNRAAYKTTFTYDNENRPTLLDFGSSRKVAYAYDGLGRISQRTVNAGSTGVTTTYGYLAGGHGTGSTTPLVQTITQSGTTLTYAYDNVGNIASVSDGSKTVSYEYDKLGQLIRVNDPYDTTAGTSGTTWKYAYDQGGNIQSKTAYAYTTGAVGSAVKTDSFAYGDSNWKDKLTAYNGQTITCDAIGNPLTDGTWTYTWQAGRQLKQMTKSGTTVSFEYDHNGLRTTKTVNGTVTNYTLHGKNIVHLSDGSNNLHFFYDEQNKPAVVIFNGTAYAYQYNLQGDVIGLVDSNGAKMVYYTYDAWGKPISKTGTLASTLGTIQPFRYRGYVYDDEIGLYYLQSRYYNSDLCRFISADTFEVLFIPHYHFGQYSLFSYCENKPISNADSDGRLSWFAKVAIGVGAVLVGAAVVAATVATGGAAAAFAGAVVAGLKSAVVSGAVAAGVSASITTVSSIASGDDINTTAKKAFSAAVDGFSSGFMWGGISFGASRFIGYITQKTRIFERKVVYGKNNFMYGKNELTIWRHGKNFRIDTNVSRGLHYHYRNAAGGIGAHRTAGIFESIGGIAGITALFD